MVSVPSFGDSFFMYGFPCSAWTSIRFSFRPLIRGFFFYKREHLGDSNYVAFRFRPLIRGFFFYVEMQIGYDIIPVCFRPLIRGFFFYDQPQLVYEDEANGFPSPHSGILFLFNENKQYNR